MFLANNMIHQPFTARLKLALPCYVKYMRSPVFFPTIPPTDDSYLSVAMPSVLLLKFEVDEFYHKNSFFFGTTVAFNYPRIAFKSARYALHNGTNDHINNR